MYRKHDLYICCTLFILLLQVFPDGSLFFSRVSLHHMGNYTCMDELNSHKAQVHQVRVQSELPAYLLPTCMQHCSLYACQPFCLPVCMTVCLLSCLPIFLLSCLPACLQTCLATCQPACLSGNLPTSCRIMLHNVFFMLSPATPVVHVSPVTQTTLAGLDIQLYCSAHGVPQPTVAWSVGGKVIRNGKQATVYCKFEESIPIVYIS